MIFYYKDINCLSVGCLKYVCMSTISTSITHNFETTLIYEEPRKTYGELVAEHTFKKNNQKIIKSIQIKLVLIKTRSRHFNQQTSALFWKCEQNMLQMVGRSGLGYV